MIRRAAPADLDALLELESVCEGPDAWSPALVAEGLAGTLPTVTWLVSGLVAGQPLSAYAVVSVAGDLAELQRIGVHPVARRRGLASALIDEVIRHAEAGGAVRLLLEVRGDNAGARALYDAHGFAEIDRRPRYYADDATALVLAREIRPTDTAP